MKPAYYKKNWFTILVAVVTISGFIIAAQYYLFSQEIQELKLINTELQFINEQHVKAVKDGQSKLLTMQAEQDGQEQALQKQVSMKTTELGEIQSKYNQVQNEVAKSTKLTQSIREELQSVKDEYAKTKNELKYIQGECAEKQLSNSREISGLKDSMQDCEARIQISQTQMDNAHVYILSANKTEKETAKNSLLEKAVEQLTLEVNKLQDVSRVYEEDVDVDEAADDTDMDYNDYRTDTADIVSNATTSQVSDAQVQAVGTVQQYSNHNDTTELTWKQADHSSEQGSESKSGEGEQSEQAFGNDVADEDDSHYEADAQQNREQVHEQMLREDASRLESLEQFKGNTDVTQHLNGGLRGEAALT